MSRHVMLIAAVLSVSQASQASAAVITIDWEGSVNFGNDALGLFGASGIVGGSSFSSRFQFDDSIATAGVTDDGTTATGIIFGAGSANITINGTTVQVPILSGGNDFHSYKIKYSGPSGFDRFISYAFTTGGATPMTYELNFQLDATNIFGQADINKSFTYDVMPGDYYNSYFTASSGGIGSVIYLIPERLRVAVSNPSAVPEPASWALTIAGFGLIGSMLRRRRRSANYAYTEGQTTVFA